MRGVFKTTDGGRTWTQGALQEPGRRSHRSGDGSSGPEHVVCGNVAADAAQVERPARRAGRERQRRLEIDRRGTHVDRREPRAAAAPVRGRIGLDAAASNPKVLYAFVDNYEAGRPATRRRARRVRPADHGSAHQGGRDLSQRRPRRDVAQGQRKQRVHERTLGHLRLGVRPDSRRSHRREHDLHAGHRAQRLARRRQDVHARCAARTAIITASGSIPAKPATLYSANDGGFYLSDDAGKSWNYARAAGGVQFYNVTLDSSTPAWAYGSIQDDGSRRGRIDLSAGRDKIPAVEFVNAPGGEGSHHAIDPADPEHRLLARVLWELHALERRAACRRRRRRLSGRAADAAARARRTRTRRGDQHPAGVARRRAAGAVDGADHHVDARAGRDLRRDISSSIARQIAASRGSGSART